MQPRIRDTPRVILVAHNGFKFDFPMLLSQCMRLRVSSDGLAKCYFVDTLTMLRAVDASVHGGCVKLQCMLRVSGDGDPLRAHRASAP